MEAVAVARVMPLKEGGECLNMGERFLPLSCTHQLWEEKISMMEVPDEWE